MPGRYHAGRGSLPVSEAPETRKPVIRFRWRTTDDQGQILEFSEDDGTDPERVYWSNRSANKSIAGARAQLLAQAADIRRRFEDELLRAVAYEAGAAEAAQMCSQTELIEDTRKEVLARLDWCAWFFEQDHRRSDVWPRDRRAELADVRAVVDGCSDLDALVRWSVICERMPVGWTKLLAADVLASAPEREGLDTPPAEPKCEDDNGPEEA
jgi:hypothetical protein